MTFSIVGTGNIAWFFGSRLVSAGHQCNGVYSRNIASAKTLAEALRAGRYSTIEDVVDGESDVCFLAVSDTAIAEIAQRISFHHTVLVHTAGAVSLDVILPSAPDCGVLWPVYSILKNNLPAHRNIPCAWEVSTEKAKKNLHESGHAITDSLFEAKYEQRKWLHLSAVISNNFTNHLLAVCEQICTDNKLPFSILLPIIEQTFERIQHSSPRMLQTGPAVRNDISTINSQTNLLSSHPEWQKIYEDITKSIIANTLK